jgi:flagellar hook assembly protein FlgD
VVAGDALGVGGRVAQLTVSARYREQEGDPASDHELASLTDADAWSGQIPVGSLPEQTLTLTARAEDEAGNWWSVSRRVEIDRSGPTVTNLGHDPDPFITDGHRFMSFLFELSDRASTVRVEIRDSGGSLAAEIELQDVDTDPTAALWDGRDEKGALVASGHYHYTDPTAALWDGRDEKGALVASGHYHYDFEVWDAAGNHVSHSGGGFDFVADTAPPELKLQTGPVFSFSDPDPLEISYAVNETARVEIEIFDASGRMVRYLSSATVEKGDYKADWDGTDHHGGKVPTHADYTVLLRATDLAGNVADTRAVVTVKP